MGKTVRVKASELKLSKRDKELLKKLDKINPNTDDIPEITDEQIRTLRKVHEARLESQRKEVLSIRITKKSIDKLKAFGPGYSNIAANMIEFCLSNPEYIKKCL